MSDLKNNSIKLNKNADQIANDLMQPVNLSIGFKAWMAFLIISFTVCMYAYVIQLKVGLGVTGLRDYVSWGMYIDNFVYFVAAALIGMFISAI